MIRCQNFIFSVNVQSVHQLQALTKSDSLVDRSLWQVAPDDLKHFFHFGDCFRLCFKLSVSLQTLHPIRDSPLG